MYNVGPIARACCVRQRLGSGERTSRRRAVLCMQCMRMRASSSDGRPSGVPEHFACAPERLVYRRDDLSKLQGARGPGASVQQCRPILRVVHTRRGAMFVHHTSIFKVSPLPTLASNGMSRRLLRGFISPV